jgi:hypothetical protein
MLKNKRQGVELSVNTMILMVLGLLILLVGVYMIFSGFNKANDSQTCTAHMGECLSQCNDAKPVPAPYSCSEKNTKCCVNMAGLGDENK